MPDSPNSDTKPTLRETLGLPHLFRSLGFAVRGASLAAAFLGLCLTLLYGGCILDPLARVFGTEPIALNAVDQYTASLQTGRPYEEPPGDYGVFEVFRQHQQRALRNLVGSPITGLGHPPIVYGVRYLPTNVFHSFISCGQGIVWLVRFHFVCFLLLAAGLLLIWSLCGGAICRVAAVQFARDERISITRALSYAKDNLIQGFFLAPCVPLAIMAFLAVFMVLYGLLLRIPFVGDLLSLAFVVVIALGFGIALLAVGSVIGGSLFFPAVAVERSDWFDAFQAGLQYPLARPWKAIWYALVTIVFALFCWFFVKLFTYLVLLVTRAVVSFGTSPFGLWSRGTEASSVSKLELLWPMSGPDMLYAWPDWSQLAWYECVSGFVIGLSVLIVIGLMWSFLISFYFCGSSVIYFLLRRDVDGTDLQELRVDVVEPKPRGAWLPPSDEDAAGRRPDEKPAEPPPPEDASS